MGYSSPNKSLDISGQFPKKKTEYRRQHTVEKPGAKNSSRKHEICKARKRASEYHNPSAFHLEKQKRFLFIL